MEHRIPEATVRRELLRAIRRTLAIYAVVFSAAGLMVMRQNEVSLPFLLVVMAPMAALVILVAVWKEGRALRGFALTLTDDAISMQTAGVLARTSIARHDVAAIEERAGYGLCVRAHDRRIVSVPAVIDGYAAINQALQAWRPFESKERAPVHVRRFLFMAAALAAFVLTFVVDDRRIVAACGVSLAVALIVSAAMVVRHPSIARKTKWSMALALIPLAMIVVRVISVVRR